MPDRMDLPAEQRPHAVPVGSQQRSVTMQSAPPAAPHIATTTEATVLQRAVGNRGARTVIQRQPAGRAKIRPADRAAMDANASRLTATNLTRLGDLYGLKRPDDRLALVRAVRSGWSQLTSVKGS